MRGRERWSYKQISVFYFLLYECMLILAVLQMQDVETVLLDAARVEKGTVNE
jgi:hypothetical protein